MNYKLTKSAKRTIAALSLLLCFVGTANAKKVVIGKNCYELNKKTMTAILTFFDKKSDIWSDSYRNEVNIPEVVEYKGKNYTITEIGADCLWRNLDKQLGLFSIADNQLTISIPKTIKHIDEEAFRYRKIRVFRVDPESPYLTVKDNILYDKSFTKAIRACEDKVIGTLVLPSTVKQIYREAFEGQHHITEVILPDGLEVIGENAFAWTYIKKITIPGSVKSIGKRAFDRSSIEDLTIGEGIEAIGSDIFGFCSFKSLKLPNSLKRIEDRAFHWSFFDNESSLIVSIPENVEYISQTAFVGDGLQFNVSSANKYYCSDENALYNKDKSQLLHVSRNAGKTYRIPSSVNSIEGIRVFQYVDTLIIDHPLNDYTTTNRTSNIDKSNKFYNNLENIKAIYAIPSEIPKIKKYNNKVYDISELK